MSAEEIKQLRELSTVILKFSYATLKGQQFMLLMVIVQIMATAFLIFINK